MMDDLLKLAPLLNLLLLPFVSALWHLSGRLAAIETAQKDHARRLNNLERVTP